MYVGRADFDQAAAYLSGFDHGLGAARHELKENGLAGFREWIADTPRLLQEIGLDQRSSAERTSGPTNSRLRVDSTSSLAIDGVGIGGDSRGIERFQQDSALIERVGCESPAPVPA